MAGGITCPSSKKHDRALQICLREGATDEITNFSHTVSNHDLCDKRNRPSSDFAADRGRLRLLPRLPQGRIGQARFFASAFRRPRNATGGPTAPDAGRETWYSEPAKVADNFYFLGTKIHSAWALVGSQGIIIIEALFDYAAKDEILGGLKKLGLDANKVKYVILSHAHGDHDGGAKLLQDAIPGVHLVYGAEDWDAIDNATTHMGGKPKRDVIGDDGMTISVGDASVRIVTTPGHTPGTLSYTFEVRDHGKPLRIAYVGGTAIPFNANAEFYDRYIASSKKMAKRIRSMWAPMPCPAILSWSKTVRLPPSCGRRQIGVNNAPQNRCSGRFCGRLREPFHHVGIGRDLTRCFDVHEGLRNHFHYPTRRCDRVAFRALDYDEGVDGWAALRAVVWIGVLLATSCAQAADFELIGHIQPEQRLVVYLQGATAPFNATTEADLNGRFHFRKLLRGTYVLMVSSLQRTVEVGPSLADSKGRVTVTLSAGHRRRASFKHRASVSVREL